MSGAGIGDVALIVDIVVIDDVVICPVFTWETEKEAVPLPPLFPCSRLEWGSICWNA